MARSSCIVVLCFTLPLVQSSLENRPMMDGFTMRLPATTNKPFLYPEKEPNGNISYKGFGILVANYLAASLNITYSFVPVNSSLIAQRGFNQALLDMVFRQEIDIITAPVILSVSRKAFVDFTYPLSFDAYKIAYPLPREASRLLAPLWPYQITVWILLMCSVLATTFVLGAMSRYSIGSHKSTDSSEHFGRMSIYVVAIALSQGDFLPYRNHSIRIAATGWCLMVIVLLNLYSSTLTSFLTLPVYEKPINSLKELVQRPDIQLILPYDSAILQTFMDAQSGVYKALGDGFRKRPENIYKTIDQGMRLFFSGDRAYTAAAFYVEYFLADDYKVQKKCRFTISKALDFTIPVSFGLPIGGRYNDIINLQIVRMWEYGLVNHWLDLYRGRYEQCIIKPKSPRMTALKLYDLYSAYIVLSFGMGLSFIIFLCEKLRDFKIRLALK